MKKNISITRAYKAPTIKVLHATAANAIMASIQDDTYYDVETPLRDLGGFAGGGDPAMAD